MTFSIFKKLTNKIKRFLVLKKSHFTEACSNFDYVFEKFLNKEAIHTGIKYKFLPSWIMTQSKYYKREIDNPEKKFRKLQRGALVFVDFGVNVGSELSNRHWAVVLNTKDSPKSKLITVVPVSSKNKKNTVEIDSLITTKSVVFIEKLNDELILKLYSVLRYSREHLGIQLSPKHIEFYESLNESLSDQYNQDFAKVLYETKLDELKSDAEKVSKLIENYKRFHKISYAKCDAIQTISKERIIFINNLDPCGKIKVNNDTLDRIDAKLKELFLNS